MKRIIYILFCVLTLGVSSLSASAATSNSTDTCENVGNVSATVNNAAGAVTLKNYNNYPVTVTWAVKGVRENGTTVIVGEGTDVLTTKGDVQTRYFTKSDQYTSYTVKIVPQRCN